MAASGVQSIESISRSARMIGGKRGQLYRAGHHLELVLELAQQLRIGMWWATG